MTMGKGTTAGDRLREIVERIELIVADKADLSDEIKVVFAAAKAEGFEPKGIRKVLKVRAMKPSERADQEMLEATYLHAMGLEASTDFAAAVELIDVDIASRESVIAALHKFTPAGGSLEIEVGGLRTRLTRDLDGVVSEAIVTEARKAEKLEPVRKAAAAEGDGVPDCDDAGAELLGRQAYRDDQPMTANPFKRGDGRRDCWDRGYRIEHWGKSGRMPPTSTAPAAAGEEREGGDA